jgi:hypothetical protein
MSGLRRWLRTCWPSAWVLCLGMVVVLTIELLARLAEYSSQVLATREVIDGCVAACYGVFRVAAFHPAFRGDYRKWLIATPWNAALPLPFGPLHLVPQDGVLLAGLVFARHNPLVPLGPLIAFLAGYLVAHCVAFFMTQTAWAGRTLAFGLALMLGTLQRPELSLAVGIVLIVITGFGLQSALAKFPWEDEPRLEKFLNAMSPSPQRTLPSALPDWPFGVLSPRGPERRVSVAQAAWLSALLAFWLWCIAPNIQAYDRESYFYFSAFVISTAAVLIRTTIYLVQHDPPISLWGRIVTRRWRIPGYDCVSVAPTAAGLASLGVVALVWQFGWTVWLLPMAPALGVFLACSLGPTLQEWHFTGQHRITPNPFQRAEVTEL